MDSNAENIEPLADTALFTPLQLGHLQLAHRIIMAPLTRMRATYLVEEGISVPNDLMAEYYTQRATKGGLLISEATPISRHAAGMPKISGIFTEIQIEGWKKVTHAVHEKGGFVYCQLWHVGRATTPSLIEGQTTLSSSNIPMEGDSPVTGEAWADSPPKAMDEEDMKSVIADFVQAAKNAMQAGFDGVEIHGANGYLIDQFLHDNVNIRTDIYGGSAINRARFPLEIIKAVTAAVGASKTGIRLSPFNYYQDTKSSDPMSHWTVLCQEIAALPVELRPAYVHMIEPRFDERLNEEEKLASLPGAMQQYSLAPFASICREAGIKFLTAGGFARETCVEPIESGMADGVVFGRLFICNPDLVLRLKEGKVFNGQDRSTFYWAEVDEEGYVDYPFLGQVGRGSGGEIDEGVDALGNVR